MCTLPCEQDDTLPKRKSLRPDAGRITTSLSAHASRERLSLAQSCGAVHESPGGGGMPGGHPGGRRGLCADVGGGGSAGDAGDVIGIEANDAIDGGISEDTAGLLDETTSSNICVMRSRESAGRCFSRLSKASLSCAIAFCTSLS